MLPDYSENFDNNLNHLESLLNITETPMEMIPAEMIADGVFGGFNKSLGVEFKTNKSTGESLLQSRNYDGAATGWRIDSAGNAYFYSITVSGYIATGGAAADISSILDIVDAGDISVKDKVAAIDCDTTIISGGKIITGLLTAANIQTGILTAITIRTAASGTRIVLDSSNTIEFFDSSGSVGYIHGSSNKLTIIGNISATSSDFDIYHLNLGDAAGAAIEFTWNNSVDIGTSSYGVRNIYIKSTAYINDIDLDGSITMDAGETVDGIDISAHTASASAHHTKTGLDDTPVNGQTAEGITSNWAYDHKASASAHHSSTSNALAITPATVVSSGVLRGSFLNINCTSAYNYVAATLYAYNFDTTGDYYLDNNHYIKRVTYEAIKFVDQGAGWTRLLFRSDLVPPQSGQGQVGYDDQHWLAVKADYIGYDVSCSEFQIHDDIQLIKDIKAKDGKWDRASFPKEVFRGGLYDLASLNGLLIGTLKQLITKVETLETKINKL